ncbi:C40 family peptidase [Nitrosomonas communis]|uniref:hypothetical protein n=1 Tax=Nitrosomonas communis TaxID=44574 RepID=UPI001652F3A5|nr:hypothetical protein [Nitrosomonas communis]
MRRTALSLCLSCKPEEVILPKTLNVADVMPGDVLLCRSDYSGASVTEVTGSKYVHAAICVRQGYAAEASGHRVKEIEIEKLLNEYDHIAVLRQPDCWSPRRVNKLQSFIDAAISRKAGFNCDGMRTFEERKKAHEENLMDKLREFFEQTPVDPAVDCKSYFCSELVAAAHVAVGIIEPSAAVVYEPSTLSPSDLADDFTFGIFCGYLIPYSGYIIPEDDEYSAAPRLDEIFENKT